jgi:hypothetical protein
MVNMNATTTRQPAAGENPPVAPMPVDEEAAARRALASLAYQVGRAGSYRILDAERGSFTTMLDAESGGNVLLLKRLFDASSGIGSDANQARLVTASLDGEKRSLLLEHARGAADATFADDTRRLARYLVESSMSGSELREFGLKDVLGDARQKYR